MKKGNRSEQLLQGLAYHAKPLKSTVKVIPTLMYEKHTIGNVMSLPMM